MSIFSHVTFAVCVSLAAIALVGLWPNLVKAQSSENQPNAVKTFENRVQFIKSIMKADKLWWSVLKDTVRFEGPRDFRPVNHYSENALEHHEAGVIITIEPFRLILDLMMNTDKNDLPFIGSQVELIMVMTTCGVMCAVLRHVSLQGFLIYYLLLQVNERRGAIIQLVKWLEQMIRLSIDKLAVMDRAVEEVGKLYHHTRRLLVIMESKRMDSPEDVDQLKIFSTAIYEILKIHCVSDEPLVPIYGTLVVDLKRSMEPDNLKEFEKMVNNGLLNGVSQMLDLADLLKYRGPLKIDENVVPSSLASIHVLELKKIITVNQVKAMFMLSNLQIASMSDEQWANLFQREPLNMDSVHNIFRQNRS